MSDLSRQLANHVRSWDVIGAALDEAVTKLETGECDLPVVALERALVEHDLEIDADCITDAMIAFVGLQATKLNTTPRQIWEKLWNEAPTDAWWRAATTRREEKDE